MLTTPDGHEYIIIEGKIFVDLGDGHFLEFLSVEEVDNYVKSEQKKESEIEKIVQNSRMNRDVVHKTDIHERSNSNQKTTSYFDFRFIPIFIIFIGVIFNFYSTQNDIKEINVRKSIIINDEIRKEIDDISNRLVYEDANGLPAQQFRMAEWQKDLLGQSTTRLLEIKSQIAIQNNFLELYVKNQTYFLMIICGFLSLISFLMIKRK